MRKQLSPGKMNFPKNQPKNSVLKSGIIQSKSRNLDALHFYGTLRFYRFFQKQATHIFFLKRKLASLAFRVFMLIRRRGKRSKQLPFFGPSFCGFKSNRSKLDYIYALPFISSFQIIDQKASQQTDLKVSRYHDKSIRYPTIITLDFSFHNHYVVTLMR